MASLLNLGYTAVKGHHLLGVLLVTLQSKGHLLLGVLLVTLQSRGHLSLGVVLAVSYTHLTLPTSDGV